MKVRLVPYFTFMILTIASCGTRVEKKETVETAGYPITAVDIRKVVINDDFWLPKIKLIRDTTIMHAFRKCEEEGRMENFLIAGKKKPGKGSIGGPASLH